MSRAGADWSDEEKKLVIRLADEGFSASLIAAQLSGRTRNAVIGFVHRNNIQIKPQKHGPPKIKISPIKKTAAKNIPKPTKAQKKSLSRLLFGKGRTEGPQPPQKPKDEAVVGKPVKFMQLRDCHCRAILGPVTGIETLYCGKQVMLGKSWCEEHFKKFYEARTTKNVKKASGNNEAHQ